MAGYGIARGGGRRLPRSAFALFLLGLAIPLQATIIPIYYVITRLHLYDTLLALILPSAAFAIPVTVIILVDFLRDVPDELFQAMRVDGAGDWRMLWSLAIPSDPARPGDRRRLRFAAGLERLPVPVDPDAEH